MRCRQIVLMLAGATACVFLTMVARGDELENLALRARVSANSEYSFGDAAANRGPEPE